MIAKLATGLVVATALAAPACAGSVERKPFGQMPNGAAVEAITLANARGLRATILTLGASVQSVKVPDRTGALADVVLGYDTLEGLYRQTELLWRHRRSGRQSHRQGSIHTKREELPDAR